ncbi:MAG TPA: nuclear transport factor 2 family protein [Chryseolinea sp.]|nr:nuclear transport factor 2 family protein [Chryseolinea sp.]
MKKISITILFAAASLSVQSQTDTMATAPCATPLEVVKTFLTAYMQKDHKTFVDLLHPDVVWEQPGDNTVSGIKKSKVELLQMGARMSALSLKTLRLNYVQYFSPSGNNVVCILHWTAAQPTGKILDIRNVDVYTVENGKITHAKIYSEDVDKENVFWGQH